MHVKVEVELTRHPAKKHREIMYESAEVLTDDKNSIVISDHLTKPDVIMAEFTMKKARETDMVDKIGEEFDYMEDSSTSWISFPKKGLAKKQASESTEERKRIYTLTVECVSGRYFEEDCVRVIEIEEKASLHDLHLAIQDAVEFDNDHLFDFYAGRHPSYQKKIWFGNEDEWENRNIAYEDIELRRVYPLKKGFKLYYLFDWGDEWIFWVRKGRRTMKTAQGVSYPRVTEQRGPNPEQYPDWDE